MKIICAGLPKTGTKSMYAALEKLGYRVYEFDKQWAYQKDEYIQAFSGQEMPDFREMYPDEIDAVMDVPSCLFYKQIFDAFPDAKVILMLRDDAESWTTSLLHTCKVFEASFDRLWVILALMFTPSGRKVATLWPFIRKGLTLDVADRSKMCEFYASHNDEVRSNIPSNQLLVMNIKEGWQPLCKFLGVDVPKIPFPHLNVGGSYPSTFIDTKLVGNRMFKELLALGALVIVVLAVVAAVFLR